LGYILLHVHDLEAYKMKVLITGAAGFLGTECVRKFRSAGYNVITTDVVGTVDYSGDLADDSFVSTLPNVDVVINCAAVQYISKNIPLIFRKSYFEKNNVCALKNLCERYLKSKAHLIHIGTSMMYQQTGSNSYDEASQMGGEGIYSYSKMKAQNYVSQYPGSATVLPCIIGGKGREGLFVNFVKMMRNYGIVCFPGKGQHKIQMVHVIDVASLVLKIAEKKASGFFNAAAPEPLSILEWVSEIRSELNLDKTIKIIRLPIYLIVFISKLLGYRFLAREQLLMLRMQHVLEIKKSLALGWEPKYSNVTIVRDIAKYIDSKMAN
jgi:nucleoside-diphosphate-sugar epimerase